MNQWLDKEEQWATLATALLKKGEAGIDSETYNQPNRTSPQHRTKVHHWSIGVLGERLHPRGYKLAYGVALPRDAFFFEPLRNALKTIRLWAHNAPHDYHSFANEELDLAIQDTLQWARVAVPGKRDYGLKTHGNKIGMEQWALGKAQREDFLTLMKHNVEVEVVKSKQTKFCLCGVAGCRSRATSTWWDESTGWFKQHEKRTESVETRTVKVVEARWDVPDFNPGHERWDRWLAYVVADAVSGIELVDWLRNIKVINRPYPWGAKDAA